MSIYSNPKTNRSFLIPPWREGIPSHEVWRFSLEDPHTGGRTGLANLEVVIAFLKEAMEKATQNETTLHSSA